MTKENFLTARWNNILTLAFGLPALIFGIIALSTSVVTVLQSFIGFFVLGAFYWTAVEQHAVKRFAWLREKSGKPVPRKLRGTHRLIFLTYNIVYWLPIILAFTPAISYRAGFIGFFAIIIIRGILNFARNNFLAPEQGEYFLLRSPWTVER